MNRDKFEISKVLHSQKLAILDSLKELQLNSNDYYQQNLNLFKSYGLNSLSDAILIKIVADIEHLRKSKQKYDHIIEIENEDNREQLTKKLIELQLLIEQPIDNLIDFLDYRKDEAYEKFRQCLSKQIKAMQEWVNEITPEYLADIEEEEFEDNELFNLETRINISRRVLEDAKTLKVIYQFDQHIIAKISNALLQLQYVINKIKERPASQSPINTLNSNVTEQVKTYDLGTLSTQIIETKEVINKLKFIHDELSNLKFLYQNLLKRISHD